MAAMKGGPKLILSGLVGIVVVAGLVIGLTRDRGESAKLVTGGPPLDGTAKVAPFSGPSLDGGTPIDIADFAGKPVIVNLWASWCGPCRKEGPDIARFSKDRPDIAVLGVNLNDDKKLATNFSREIGWTHRSIFDPGGTVGADTLKVANLPVTIYIDANGIERGRTQGEVTYDDLVRAADRL